MIKAHVDNQYFFNKAGNNKPKHAPKRGITYWVDIRCPHDPEYIRQVECASLEACRAKIQELSGKLVFKGCKLEVMICL